MFGPLETRVLEALWLRGEPASVRDLRANFPAVAYTTLMTTLDRLYRKRVLEREKIGRAFVYRPSVTREQWHTLTAGSALATMLSDNSVAARPILAMFVDAVSQRDRSVLDELERLVQARREALNLEDQK